MVVAFVESRSYLRSSNKSSSAFAFVDFVVVAFDFVALDFVVFAVFVAGDFVVVFATVFVASAFVTSVFVDVAFDAVADFVASVFAASVFTAAFFTAPAFAASVIAASVFAVPVLASSVFAALVFAVSVSVVFAVSAFTAGGVTAGVATAGGGVTAGDGIGTCCTISGFAADGVGFDFIDDAITKPPTPARMHIVATPAMTMPRPLAHDLRADLAGARRRALEPFVWFQLFGVSAGGGSSGHQPGGAGERETGLRATRRRQDPRRALGGLLRAQRIGGVRREHARELADVLDPVLRVLLEAAAARSR